jgi:hypothetical protein
MTPKYPIPANPEGLGGGYGVETLGGEGEFGSIFQNRLKTDPCFKMSLKLAEVVFQTCPESTTPPNNATLHSYALHCHVGQNF